MRNKNGTNCVRGCGLKYVPMHRINALPERERMTPAEWWALAFMATSLVALIVVALDVFVWRP